MKNTYTHLSTMLILICLFSFLIKNSKVFAQGNAMLSSKNIENRRWQLIMLNGKKIKGSSYTHFLKLHDYDTTADSKVACNHLRYTYELDKKGNLMFKNGTTTLMACPNQEMEEIYRIALSRTKRYVINKQQLFLIGADKKILAIFQLVPNENGQSFVGKTFIKEGIQSYDPILGGAPFLRFESNNKASLKLGDIVELMDVQYDDDHISMRAKYQSHEIVYSIVNKNVLMDDYGVTWVLKNK